MSKIIFISNRLPVTAAMNDDKIEYSESIGGLATGLKNYHRDSDNLWAGWPGIADEDLNKKQKDKIRSDFKKDYKCIPIFLSHEEMGDYYYGFCNKTIWPLFHYFSNKAEYELNQWESYVDVNRKFYNSIKDTINDGDTIWVHDYQLMLLPEMIKENHPNTKVGFFLHIPFPSYELFRLLPWREEVLKGILGSDLVGFHIYDYVRHFLSSVRRILGLEHSLNRVSYGSRYIQADVFPMGIDYKRFAESHKIKEIQNEAKDIVEKTMGTQVILSVDRLDYTKGIPERINAFNQFLTNYPEYRERVTLILIVAPSRTEVDTYDELKREIQELVSQTNGKHGTVGWVPIWFFFRTFKIESLMAFYQRSDVLLVTPLRDGMNLVAKEYIASRKDMGGMVVISETAGAVSELGEAVVVNANNRYEVAKGLKKALDMTKLEKIKKNEIMHKRLERYNVEFWAEDFLDKLECLTADMSQNISTEITNKEKNNIVNKYNRAEKRLLFLDYDGTLMGFKPKPELARPDKKLLRVLKKLASDERNTVVIISGRDKDTLDSWLGSVKLNMVASHGLWMKTVEGEWDLTEALNNDWKESIRPILEVYTDRTPGALIEEKEYSIAWHYRRCEPDLVQVRLSELRDALMSLTEQMNIGLLEGNKVLEVKDKSVNKGRGASQFLTHGEYDFIWAVGDDYTDEDMFQVIPENGYSVKIGVGATNAKYHLKSSEALRSFLEELADL